MARYISITLTARGVSCTARLLDDVAPRTCAAVWDALPQAGQVYHGKYARNEIYNLLPGFAEHDPGKENTTVTPIPGDVCWFRFDSDDLGNPGYGYEEAAGVRERREIIDLALFYGRNNLLINGDQGWVPGNVFATVVDGLETMAEACQSIWMDGARGETLAFARAGED
ncbi:DUF3830 family protein [Nesterenkonia xinjiangensis]|uniref:DUF3830 family protein n=1 Tax=Nesterenkonia xinjiangensis TaxID=225327 RepID=A0A7Z0GMA7_9MICC|nr:DUF3830 family protein [Nesterenkonia xinjiangensis]NYJ78599.1 hypothetical protein [Nesterenkonia xinjiangensis]